MHKQKVETFRKSNLDAFYALMLLCEDGANCDILEEVLERLARRKRRELIAITRFFAGKVLTSEEDRLRSERKFTVLRDFLKDSWTFQETLQEGRAIGLEEGHGIGLEEGRELGLEEGRLEEVRRNIEAMVQARFPELRDFVKSKIALLTDRDTLQSILLAVGTARDKEEVKRFLHTF